jgi:hypothetical protein
VEGTPLVALVPGTPDGEARELHDALVAILKLLNRAEEEGGSVAGFEREELVHRLARSGVTGATGAEVDRALSVLVANGLAQRLTDPEYAWDRGRLVEERYAITLDGKRLLLKELERVGRV